MTIASISSFALRQRHHSAMAGSPRGKIAGAADLMPIPPPGPDPGKIHNAAPRM
jgi:hypothetical protein